MSIKSFLKKASGYDAIRNALRSDRRFAAKRQDTQIQRTVADARAAGIHPLFALGGATGGGGGTYPSTGSNIGNALRSIRAAKNITTGKSQPSLVDNALVTASQAQARLADARTDTVKWNLQNSIDKRAEGVSNSQQDQIIIPDMVEGATEIKKGQVDPFFKKNPEQSLNVKSPMTKFRIGSQEVWLPVEDMETVIEDPATVFAAAYSYKGNKNVDFGKLALEYSGKKSLFKFMMENVRKKIPVKVRKKHLLKKYARQPQFGVMP